MSRQVGRAVGGLVGTLLLAGCAAAVKPLDPALFPPQPAAHDRDATPIRLDVADPAQRYRSPRLNQPPVEVDLPIGAIVEAAGRLALAAQFAPSTDAAPWDPRALRLRVDGVVAEVDSRWVYFVPLGPIPFSRSEVTTRLAFAVGLIGPDGAVHWTQRYDSGPQALKAHRRGLLIEPPPDGAQRQLHEQAALLMGQAAADLRTWLQQERRRDRVL